MCWIMSCPDGWRGILAGITGHILQTMYLFFCMFEDLTAAVWQRMAVRQHLVMKRRATPSLVPLTNESRQRWSGSALTPRALPRWKKKKKRDLLMLDRFPRHIHYWARWWAEKCELPAGSTVRTSGQDALWCGLKILNSVCIFFSLPPFLKIMGLFEGQPSQRLWVKEENSLLVMSSSCLSIISMSGES